MWPLSWREENYHSCNFPLLSSAIHLEKFPFAHYVADVPTTSFIDLFTWLRSRVDNFGLLSCMSLAWAAWSYHNYVVHEELWSNVVVSAMGFLKLVHDYNGYVTNTQGQLAKPPVISCASWVLLREGWFRVNSDASMLNDHSVGVGAVIRDAKGRVVRDAVRRYHV